MSDLVRSIIEPATKRLSSSLGVNASVNGEFVVWNVDNEYGPQFSVRYNENLFRLSFLEFGLVYPVPSPWSEEMFIEVVEDILAIAEMCTKGEYLVGRRKRVLSIVQLSYSGFLGWQICGDSGSRCIISHLYCATLVFLLISKVVTRVL